MCNGGGPELCRLEVGGDGHGRSAGRGHGKACRSCGGSCGGVEAINVVSTEVVPTVADRGEHIGGGSEGIVVVEVSGWTS